MSLINQLSEAWKSRQTDLSGQTWFDLTKHMEEAISEEKRLAAWSISPEDWNKLVKRNRRNARLLTPVSGIVGLVLVVVLLMLLKMMGLDPSGGLIVALALGLPLWMMVSTWRNAGRRWPFVDTNQDVVIGQTMGVIAGQPAVWDHMEGAHQTVVRSVSVERGALPKIVIKTKSRHGYKDLDYYGVNRAKRATVFNWAIEIPTPSNKLAEAEQIVRAIDKHATREFADV
jgi:hypothetical protein